MQTLEHLRDAIVSEHGETGDVVEGAVGRPVEAGPQVGDEDLRALVQTDFAAVERGGIAEVREVLDQHVHQSCGGAVGSSDNIGWATAKLRVEDLAGLAEDGDAVVE